MPRYVDVLMCHDINGFDMVHHGSQAISTFADKHIIFIFKNSVANLRYEICAFVNFKTSNLSTIPFMS